jgi:hypothetical protein
LQKIDHGASQKIFENTYEVEFSFLPTLARYVKISAISTKNVSLTDIKIFKPQSNSFAIINDSSGIN